MLAFRIDAPTSPLRHHPADLQFCATKLPTASEARERGVALIHVDVVDLKLLLRGEGGGRAEGAENENCCGARFPGLSEGARGAVSRLGALLKEWHENWITADATCGWTRSGSGGQISTIRLSFSWRRR